MSERIGLLFVGNNGANARATKSSLHTLIAEDDKFTRLGISTLKIIDQKLLPRPSELIISGWDVRGKLEGRLVPDGTTAGVLLPADTLNGDEEDALKSTDFSASVDQMIKQIDDFRIENKLTQVIVVNLSSPPRRVKLSEEICTRDSFFSQSSILPSAFAYAFSAISAGCHYVDFTPSQVLECRFLLEEAERNRVQVAGRDGSTGQTFMKLLVSSALLMRGFNITSWYSANILGNRDGEVLMIPGVDETKQGDKQYGLNLMSGIEQSNHHVDIQYIPYLGDVKEAWDSMTCEDFMGNQIEIKLIWRAQDSPLAAQLILDLVRLIAAANGTKFGLRRDLSIFFKHPIKMHPRSPFSFFSLFLAENQNLLLKGKDCVDLDW